MRPYGRPVSIRTLLAMLIALAVLFAPSAVAAQHLASMPGHDMQMMEMGHCDAPPSNSDHGKGGKSCCVSMCTAIAITPGPPIGEVEVEHAAATYFTGAASWHGYLGEIATPPPRAA